MAKPFSVVAKVVILSSVNTLGFHGKKLSIRPVSILKHLKTGWKVNNLIIHHQYVMYPSTACYCYVTYSFQSVFTLYSYLNDKELLARNRQHICSLSESNETQTHNQLVRKRTLNHVWTVFSFSLFLSPKCSNLLHNHLKKFCVFWYFDRSTNFKYRSFLSLFSISKTVLDVTSIGFVLIVLWYTLFYLIIWFSNKGLINVSAKTHFSSFCVE